MPKPEVRQGSTSTKRGVVFFGTSTFSTLEALDILADQGQQFDVLRIKAFPFGAEVEAFIREHEEVFVVEQNRDAQMRTVIMTELETDPRKLISVLNYDGMPITAATILEQIRKFLPETKSVPA